MSHRSADIAAEIASDLTGVLQHHASTYNLSAPANCHIMPQAIISVLAATIALNFDRKGHGTLVKRSSDRLAEMVDEAFRMGEKLSGEDKATVNPMAACSCGVDHPSPLSDGDPLSDADIGDGIARAIAAALGLPASAVRAVSVPSAEAAAVEKSDDPANMAAVAKDVDDMLARIFGGGTSKH